MITEKGRQPPPWLAPLFFLPLFSPGELTMTHPTHISRALVATSLQTFHEVVAKPSQLSEDRACEESKIEVVGEKGKDLLLISSK
jgi:hypothetical protein